MSPSLRSRARVAGGLRVAIVLSLIAAFGAIPSAGSAVQVPSIRLNALPKFAHVVIVVMENREYGSIIGSANAPYINSLANQYALATNMYGTTHPSLPNYLALIGGSTFGITSNCTTCHVNATNLVDQLEGAQISWKAYIESIPKACAPDATSGLYAKKHNPFMYFDSITQNASRCAKVVPLTRLTTDLQNGALPTFSFITPNMCNSMHDCSVKSGDTFLSGLIPKILPALGSNGVLFLTFDEGTTNAGCCTYAAGGHIATVVAGPGAQAGKTSGTAYDQYSILRTIEDAWGLARLGRASCTCSAAMTALIKTTLISLS